MARPRVAIDAKRVVPASRVNSRNARERALDDYSLWLPQARRVRDEGLHLLRECFTKDLDSAAQLFGSRNPEALAFAAEYAAKLSADYLADSEKLFALMSDPVQHPQRRTRRKR